MAYIEQHRLGSTLSTDPARLQIDVIHEYLSRHSYWAQGRPLEIVKRSIENSLCYGIYKMDAQGREQQVAFSRVVTDYATFAWLCDVFVLESQRGEGLGKWLVESVVCHPDLLSVRRIILATRDMRTSCTANTEDSQTSPALKDGRLEMRRPFRSARSLSEN